MQLHRKEEEEGDRGDQDKERGNQKRETYPASKQFPKCCPQLGIHKEIHRVGSEEKGEGGDRGDLVEKKESQKGQRAIKAVVKLSSKNGQ